MKISFSRDAEKGIDFVDLKFDGEDFTGAWDANNKPIDTPLEISITRREFEAGLAEYEKLKAPETAAPKKYCPLSFRGAVCIKDECGMTARYGEVVMCVFKDIACSVGNIQTVLEHIEDRIADNGRTN